MIDAVVNSLLKPMAQFEVRVVVFEMSPLKTLGPNEFNVHFFQHDWEIVRDCPSRMVLEASISGKIGREMNKTLICLILKTRGPDCIQ